jgi:hypothetical protein
MVAGAEVSLNDVEVCGEPHAANRGQWGNSGDTVHTTRQDGEGTVRLAASLPPPRPSLHLCAPPSGPMTWPSLSAAPHPTPHTHAPTSGVSSVGTERRSGSLSLSGSVSPTESLSPGPRTATPHRCSVAYLTDTE